MTEFLLDGNRKGLVGAELGVKFGDNAFSMLKFLDLEKLYLVDHYGKYVECGRELDFGYAFPIAKKKLMRFGDRAVFIRKDVNEAMTDIKDCLDFVWVDVSGEYDVMFKCLRNYYPLLRVGGLLGGKRFNSNWFGVCRAVFEFVDEFDLDLVGGCSGDWRIVKK